MIDQGLVDLGRPRVTTGPLPTHNTRVVPPPLGGIHSIEFLGGEIFMMDQRAKLFHIVSD